MRRKNLPKNGNTVAVQDDRRELEQIELFELTTPAERSRSDTDAILEVDGKFINFELKSTTKSSVTTVRDFGMDHIKKWADRHWLFGYYKPSGNALMFTRYASPAMMAPWIDSKRQYIELDTRLAKLAAVHLVADDLFELIGEKKVYSLQDAQALHKKQLTVAEYQERFDLPGGYSSTQMLEILKLRCIYVVERGSTLNNPKVPKTVLDGFPKITEDHAQTLRDLVLQSFNN